MPNKKHPFRKGSRGGFTLVELLVVISIIAILGAVAFPALTTALRRAKEAAASETGRGLALSLYQYASDNNQTFPAAATSTLVFDGLTSAYIKNTDALWISGGTQTKFAGADATKLAAANVSWDLTAQSTSLGLGPNDPDQTPLIISTGSTITYPAAGAPAAATAVITTPGNNPFGSDGVAVGYKDCTAAFNLNRKQPTASFNISSGSFNPNANYTQLTP